MHRLYCGRVVAVLASAQREQQATASHCYLHNAVARLYPFSFSGNVPPLAVSVSANTTLTNTIAASPCAPRLGLISQQLYGIIRSVSTIFQGAPLNGESEKRSSTAGQRRLAELRKRICKKRSMRGPLMWAVLLTLLRVAAAEGVEIDPIAL